MNDAAFRRVEIIKVLTISDIRIKGKDLAERFNVSKKTIEKDIAKIEDVGYELDKTNGPSGGYLLKRPAPEIDYFLCHEDQELYVELMRMKSSEENNNEMAQRILSEYREMKIREIFK